MGRALLFSAILRTMLQVTGSVQRLLIWIRIFDSYQIGGVILVGSMLMRSQQKVSNLPTFFNTKIAISAVAVPKKHLSSLTLP